MEHTDMGVVAIFLNNVTSQTHKAISSKSDILDVIWFCKSFVNVCFKRINVDVSELAW